LMKQFLLLAVVAFSGSQIAGAAACGPTSLTAYVALGSTGCTIGSDTLYNFQILAGTGVTELAGGSVTLAPSGSIYAPSIAISINQSATAGNGIETMFTYDISGPLYTGISSVLSGASESTMNDGVTGIVNFCEGGSFGPDGVDGCVQPNSSLLTLDGVQNTDMASFGAVPFLNVTDDFLLLSGGGTAFGGTLTNAFTAVPEPVSTALAGFGLALAGILKVRSNRAK
jgi:hypothetical protein